MPNVKPTTNQTKVVRLIVDKWFVDKCFGFGKTTTGEIVFIHASVVQGGEVLMVGTDAWAQVVSDHTRAEEGVPSTKSLGTQGKAGGKGQGESEPSGAASKASSGTDGRVCSSIREEDRPGLDELAKHIGALNRGAGGSHPQATMMQEESAVPAASSHPFASPAVGSLLPLTQSFDAAGKDFSNLKGAGRGARSRSVARGQDATARVEEIVGFYVKATGKDETQIRQRVADMKPDEVRRSREHWRLHAGEKQRF